MKRRNCLAYTGVALLPMVGVLLAGARIADATAPQVQTYYEPFMDSKPLPAIPVGGYFLPDRKPGPLIAAIMRRQNQRTQKNTVERILL